MSRFFCIFAPLKLAGKRLNAKTRLFCIFLGKDCSKPEDEERNVPHSTEL